MTDDLEVIELCNRARAFLDLKVSDQQQGLFATVAESYADALFPPDYGWGIVEPWIRGITRAGEPAGFIMCAEPTHSQPNPWIWRLLVDHRHQGLGVGTFAMRHAILRYQAMGCSKLFVSWSAAEHNASGFYLKLGFQPTGDTIDGELIAALEL